MRPPFSQRHVADYAIRSRIEEDALIDLQWVAAARFAGITVGIAMFFLFAALMSFLVGCNGATPTLYGKPIQDKAVANATKTIHVAEVSAATGVRMLAIGIKIGAIPPEMGDTFVREIDPKVKAAMIGVKSVLKTMETSPSDTTAQKVIEATLILQDVLNTVQAYLLNPEEWVATQGVKP